MRAKNKIFARICFYFSSLVNYLLSFGDNVEWV